MQVSLEATFAGDSDIGLQCLRYCSLVADWTGEASNDLQSGYQIGADLELNSAAEIHLDPRFKMGLAASFHGQGGLGIETEFEDQEGLAIAGTSGLAATPTIHRPAVMSMTGEAGFMTGTLAPVKAAWQGGSLLMLDPSKVVIHRKLRSGPPQPTVPRVKIAPPTPPTSGELITKRRM